MGKITAPLPAKLIVPMFTGDLSLLGEAQRALIGYLGPVDFCSAQIPFAYTTYYEPEFGGNLVRQFLAFERLVDPGRLAEIKVLTNSLEEGWSAQGHRRINLDPGYISEAKLVLATTKNHSHRIYLGQGIYAEVTLSWRDKDFRPWPWTYPDYQSEVYLEVFRAIRKIYCEQIRALGLKGRVTPPPG
jgi:hypothetical protein